MTEYFSQNLWLIWLLAAIVCLIAELCSGTVYVLCFSIGALCAMLVSLLFDSFYVQMLVFAVCSFLSIWFIRPFVLTYLHREKDTRVSNAEALIGRVGTVSEAIEADGYGRVAIDGDDWKAVERNGLPIEKGEKVRVVSMESIIITVEKA